MDTGLKKLALAATLVTLVNGAAVAQSLTTNSCVEGFVPAYDYAELSQSFAEGGWTDRAEAYLVSESEELTLKVLDSNGTMVCDNVADLRTRCRWPISWGMEYSLKIDNTTRNTQTSYRLCAR